MEKADGWDSCKERILKLLITMHMPSAQGYSVHQITVDHPSENIDQFCRVINDYEFIKAQLFYRRRDDVTGKVIWNDKGELLINTSHIGKVQEFFEYGEREHDDESYGYSEGFSGNSGRQGPPLRKRGGHI